MQRILLVIGGAAALCAIGTLFLQLAIARGLPVEELVLATAIATLMLAIATTVLSYRAINRANEVASELERVSRSMEAAIKDVSARGDRDAAVLGEFSSTIKRKLDALSRTATPATDKEHDEPHAGSHGASRRVKQPAHETDAAEDGVIERPGVEVALRLAVSGDHANLSLQPIIAAGRGAAGGFEVHFHIQPDEGKPVDIRRLSKALPDLDMAAIERLAVVSASEIARKRPGEINERMPLHVAISDALLMDELEFTAVLDLFRLHPALARSIVVSLPAKLAESDALRAQLETLKALDVGLAVEDWSGSVDGLDKIKDDGCAFIKLSAERLLSKNPGRKGASSGEKLIAMIAKAGIEIIATDVASDEDAVRLIEIGIDLMTGQRLSPPRAVKNEHHSPISA